MVGVGAANSQAANDWASKRRQQMERAERLRAERKALQRGEAPTLDGEIEGENGYQPIAGRRAVPTPDGTEPHGGSPGEPPYYAQQQAPSPIARTPPDCARCGRRASRRARRAPPLRAARRRAGAWDRVGRLRGERPLLRAG